MDVIYPDTGLVWMLHQIAKTTPGLIFHLYGNNLTPGLGNVLGDFSAMDAVYPPITVANADFTLDQVTAHVGATQAPNISWTNTSGVPQTCYGYYVTDGAGTILVQAARFDGAPVITPNGGKVSVTPILGGYSGLTS